jgi:uncharacterized membrane protein YjgN (DUF898 family)
VNDHGTAALTTCRFDFTGRNGEYCRIWVVSLFLWAVTLGIYSARSKVRKKRYLYSHTELRLQLHAKEESGSLLQYLSTHPATEEQIQRAEEQR